MRIRLTTFRPTDAKGPVLVQVNLTVDRRAIVQEAADSLAGRTITNPTKSRQTPSSAEPLPRKPDSRDCGRIGNERHPDDAASTVTVHDDVPTAAPTSR
jgi:hypothetical protein